MELGNLSIGAAIMATMKEGAENKEDAGKKGFLFYLYCQQAKKLFSFCLYTKGGSGFSIYRFDKSNIVMKNNDSFYDFADKHLYLLSENNDELWNWDIANLTTREFIGVKYSDGVYKVVDYRCKEVCDFEYISGDDIMNFKQKAEDAR